MEDCSEPLVRSKSTPGTFAPLKVLSSRLVAESTDAPTISCLPKKCSCPNWSSCRSDPGTRTIVAGTRAPGPDAAPSGLVESPPPGADGGRGTGWGSWPPTSRPCGTLLGTGKKATVAPGRNTVASDKGSRTAPAGLLVPIAVPSGSTVME